MHCHLRTDGLGGTVIADLEYPPRVAFVLLSTLLERFAVDVTNWASVTQQESINYPPVQEAIQEYQDPAKADKITKIRRDLDETTEILVRTCSGKSSFRSRTNSRSRPLLSCHHPHTTHSTRPLTQSWSAA